jgi:hypothetical protein
MVTKTQTATAADLEPLKQPIVHRPLFQLRSLPIPIRWEVTRRHAYYQLAWKRFLDHHQGTPVTDPGTEFLRQLAILHLGAIGVSGPPPDPATEFESLDAADLKRAWLSGAVHPISFRGIVGLLVAALPQETLQRVGQLLVEAAEPDQGGKPPAKLTALLQLPSMNCPGLDQFPDEPIVSINPAASERQLAESLDELLKEWKQQRGLAEQRARSDKHAEYLEVWDLREGWHAGRYVRERELTLRKIAQRTKRPLPTVGNQYERAFQMIVGYPYSRELWVKVFGGIKFSELYGKLPGPVTRRRPLVSPTGRPVAESTLLPRHAPASAVGLVTGTAEVGAAVPEKELLGDIQTLIGRGRSDQQIVDELDLMPESLELVAYLRGRTEDGI